MSESPKEGYLTLVGSNLYTADAFEKEGKKYGIQRALQLNVLSHMHWGDQILFGIHDRSGEGRKGGNVRIFGKSYINGISYTLPPELKEKIVERLHVTNTIDAAGLEQRQCGSYFAAGGVEVTDSIEEIASIISDICKAAKVKTSDFKYFIRGSFYRVSPEQVVESSMFRGMKKIAVPTSQKENIAKHAVIGLESYARRSYLTKKEKEALTTQKLDSEEAT